MADAAAAAYGDVTRQPPSGVGGVGGASTPSRVSSGEKLLTRPLTLTPDVG